MSDFEPLPITKDTLVRSIIQDTPEYTKRLLMELNPGHWGKYFKLRVVK